MVLSSGQFFRGRVGSSYGHSLVDLPGVRIHDFGLQLLGQCDRQFGFARGRGPHDANHHPHWSNQPVEVVDGQVFASKVVVVLVVEVRVNLRVASPGGFAVVFAEVQIHAF